MSYLKRNCTHLEGQYIFPEEWKKYRVTKPPTRYVEDNANSLELKPLMVPYGILDELFKWHDMVNSVYDKYCEQERSGCEMTEVEATESADSKQHTQSADSGSEVIATPTLPMITRHNVPYQKWPSHLPDQFLLLIRSLLYQRFDRLKRCRQSDFSNDTHKSTELSPAKITKVQPIDLSADKVLQKKFVSNLPTKTSSVKKETEQPQPAENKFKTTNITTPPPSAEGTSTSTLRPVNHLPSTSQLNQQGTSYQQTNHNAKKSITLYNLYRSEFDEIDSSLQDIINKTQECRSKMAKLF
ncbi:GSCOCG00002555001-RA-CDS [Cotesia congregata]|uniref:Uncharacterized protein n=1 Tax=Cotesia congregata TaxID=51543 RepID=A0A8J2H766_COTCN|nr:GSCOCG00002555001-RA-CDS [Cotesia congregata]CAG5081493.1 Protein of unknown function [Cotesia congregata]